MLTNLKLYNVKKTELQRTINIDSIKALTKSMDAKRSTSFIVHVSNEYDYQFESDFRDDVFTQIKYYYWQLKKKNLPIFAVSDSIDEFATKKTDIQKDREVLPSDNSRVKTEDIYPEEAGAEPTTPTTKQMNPQDVYANEVAGANQEIMKMRANTIFQRGLKKDEKPADLDTF